MPGTKRAKKTTKAKVRAMAQSALQRSSLPAPDPAYEFYVSTDGVRVIVSGTYDGNIRATDGELIRFTYVGDPSYGGFVITATEFKKNSNKSSANKKQPFNDPLPTEVVLQFQSTLKVGSGNQRLLKYQINVGDLIPADPVIIIQR